MTSSSPYAYPAEYYYPEFIDSRTDDPRRSPPARLPISTSIDNGVGSSTRMTTKTPQANSTVSSEKPVSTKQRSGNLGMDVVTDQGLPDVDINQAVKTDPKRNLLRDPVERNIPRLIVDDSIVQQAMRTPRMPTDHHGDGSNDENESEEMKRAKQLKDGSKSSVSGQANGNLKNQSKKPGDSSNGRSTAMKNQRIKYVEDEKPIDDYWQKAVQIDEEGAVSVQPLNYDRPTFEGPFGLTRKGALIFYITMAIFTLLAAAFLIMTGVFYANSYPSSTSNTGTIAGMGICGFAFYLGLQLILIALWHQRYRQENPTKIIKKSTKRHESTENLKTSMEANGQYDYQYQPPVEYTPYGGYPPAPYSSTVTEQMLLQQPGGATGAAYYDPVVWPTNVDVETQPDPRFLQPMEYMYGPPGANGYMANPSTTPAPTLTTDYTKPAKKTQRTEPTKTVAPQPPKAKFDNIFPNSSVTDASIPTMKNAPETTEMMRTIAEMERNNPPSNSYATGKSTNQVRPGDVGKENSSSRGNESQRHRRSHRRRSRSRRHHRHSSYSPCSTCSNRSRNDHYSNVSYNSRQPRRAARSQTLSPSDVNRSLGMGIDMDSEAMRTNGYTVGLEDVPNVRDDRLEQIPVVRRTIIVDPYPVAPTSQIVVKPNKNTGIANGTVTQSSNLPKTKKSTKQKTTGRDDLQLEDVYDDYASNTQTKATVVSKKKQTSSHHPPSKPNAFYS